MRNPSDNTSKLGKQASKQTTNAADYGQRLDHNPVCRIFHAFIIK